MNTHNPVKIQAAKVAYEIAGQKDVVVWDTETTGLYGNDRLVSIALTNINGDELFYSLINPEMPISPGASRIHGIREADVLDAPTMVDIYPKLKGFMSGKTWAIYNSSFDIPKLNNHVANYNLEQIQPKFSHCIMDIFSSYYGSYSDYHSSYTWQKLIVAANHFKYKFPAHNALEDAKATAAVIRGMSEWLKTMYPQMIGQRSFI